MGKPQEAWTAFEDSDKNARSEYSFVYNRAVVKKIAGYYGIALLIVFVVAILAMLTMRAGFSPYVLVQPIVILVISLILIVPLIIFSFYGPRLIVNREGMICTGFWLGQMPRRCAWNELLKYGEIEISWLERPALRRQFVFMFFGGKTYALAIRSFNYEQFIGVGHTLSLEEAIRRFAGPLSPLSDIEKVRLAFGRQANQSKEETRVIYLASGLMIFAAFFKLLLDYPFLLDNITKTLLYWILVLGAMAAVCWYMRRIKRKIALLFPTLFFGGVVFLLFPLFISHLSAWLGKKERVVFTISKENDRRQHWTAVTDANLTFSICTRAENRIYKGIGTTRELTVYRGPGSLNALPAREYHALFHEAQVRWKREYQKCQ